MSFAHYRRLLVLSAVLAIACVFYRFIQPIGRPADPDSLFFLAAIGAIFVPPALLGFWTSLSVLPLLVRMSSGLFAMFLLAASLALGIQEPNGPRMQSAQNATAIVVQFALTLLVLSVFRWLFRWELRSPDESPRRAAGQFSILAILIWTLEAALILGLLQYWFQAGRIDRQPESTSANLKMAALQGLFMAGIGLASVPIAWLILSRGLAQLIGAILTAISLFALALIVIQFASSSRTSVGEAVTLTSGLAVMSAIILFGFRLGGERLVRAPRQVKANVEST